MSLKVFDILQEIRALEDILNEVDPVSGEFVNNEDDIKEYINKLNIDKATKLNNIEDLKQELSGQIDTLKTKIDKLSARKKSIESNIDRLKDLQLLLLDGEKLKTDEYTFSFRSSSSVNVYDIEQLDDKYFKIEKKPILKDIGEAIKNANLKGESFFGAEVVNKVSLSIR